MVKSCGFAVFKDQTSKALPTDLVGLAPLMKLTSGRPDLVIGLIDGPVVIDHPDLNARNIREIATSRGTCTRVASSACVHATFVAGILSARRGSAAPAICPDCTLLIRPIFAETAADGGDLPSASAEELSRAIFACMESGARLLNISAGLPRFSVANRGPLKEALDETSRRGVIVVAAAGNQGSLGSTSITGHPWVIPVVAYDRHGKPMEQSNLGNSIGKRGLGAPGDRITSLGARGGPLTLGGTSAATPFVTGAIALLWSKFPSASAAEVKFAVIQAQARRRSTIVPPLLNAWAAYQSMRR